MKKLVCVLFTLFLLCACGSANANTFVSNPDDVIVELGSNKTTKQELYEVLKANGSLDVLAAIFNQIAGLYDIDIEALEKEADSYISMYLSMGYSSYIEYYYGSIEAYRAALIDSAITKELASVYVKDHYDSQVSNDKPVLMQKATFNSKEEAQSVIDAVNSGSTFDMACVNAGVETAPEKAVYIDSSDLEITVKEYLNSTDSIGLSTMIPSTSTSKDENGDEVETVTYTLLNIISRDVEEFKDDYIALAASKLEEVTVRQYFLTKHNVTFYDQDLYDVVSSTYEVVH